jgi:hypothetical protein
VRVIVRIKFNICARRKNQDYCKFDH